MYCFVNPLEVDCRERCERVLKCFHQCVLKCYQKCSLILCQITVEKKLECGHKVKANTHIYKNVLSLK